MKLHRWSWIGCAISALCSQVLLAAEPPTLTAHWPLAKDARDVVGSLHGKATNVEFTKSSQTGGQFNGRDSVIEIPDAEALHLGQRDFSFAMRVQCETPMTNTLGDL